MDNKTLFFVAAAALAVIGVGVVFASTGNKEEAEDDAAPALKADAVEDVDEDASSKKSWKKKPADDEVVVEDDDADDNNAPAPPTAPPATDAAATADAAAATADAAAATDAPAPSAADAAVAEAAARRTTLKEEFNDMTRKGTKMMKAQAFEKAAKFFGRAIEIAEELDMAQGSLETLYNNRAAMFEKAGMMDASLEDCTVVLAMNPGHVKVRKRRARIYQAQGRVQDALVEYCAVLVADTADMRKRLEPFKEHPQLFAQQQQKIMEEKGGEAMATQEKLQEVMALCGKDKADALLKAREGGGGGALPGSGTISSESSVFQLLLSYTEYLDAEDLAGAASLEDLTDAVKAANGAGLDDAEDGLLLMRLSALKDRALHFMVRREYGKASDDLMAAYAAFLGAHPTGGPGGEAAVECAGILRWVALFHHVKYDLDGALAVYDRAAELAASDPAALCLVEVMRSGVHVDRGDQPAAEAAIARAGALCEAEGGAPTVDLLMHRSQLLVLKPDFEASEVDLRACLERRPGHAVALLRLAMMLIGQAQTAAQQGQEAGGDAAAGQAEAMGKLAEAEAAVAKVKKLRPFMSEVYQVEGSIGELKGDVEAAMGCHDKAIGLDPKNPTPYINKGMLLAQVGQPSSQEEALAQGQQIMGLYAKAIEVDPLCSQAQKLLAEMKLRFATEFAETEAIVANLEGAIGQCRDPAELVELCTFSCIASAQLEAARDLGMSSFADLGGGI